MIAQIETFRVERWKRLKSGRWAWVIIGHYLASCPESARALGRKALADEIAILRAVPVGGD